jgi:hypothetical protein
MGDLVPIGDCLFNGFRYCVNHSGFACYGPKVWSEGDLIGPPVHCGGRPVMIGRGFCPGYSYCDTCIKKIRAQIDPIIHEEVSVIMAQEAARNAKK